MLFQLASYTSLQKFNEKEGYINLESIDLGYS